MGLKHSLMFLLIVPSIASANNAYVGLGGGYDSTDFSKTLSIVTPNGKETYDKKDDLSGTGAFVNGYAGYQWNFAKLFLGAEVMGGVSQLKYHAYYIDSCQIEASRGDFTINKSYGVSVLPGFFIFDNVGIYGRVGLVRGEFKYSEYKDNRVSTDVGLSERKWLNGLKYGVGVVIPLQKKLRLRIEGNRIQYQTYVNKTFPMQDASMRTIKLTPYSNEVEINLIYTFM